MKLYHGTTVSGLETLCAGSCDRQGKRVLYLTDNWVYSLFYIRDRDIDFVTCGVGSDGVIHYDEKFPDQLSILYRGMSGYIYEVEAEAEKTKINGIYVTDGETRVTGTTYVPDVYEAIVREIENGNVELLPYISLTDAQKALNHEGAVYMIRSCPMNPRKELFFREYFSDAWEEANHNK